FVVVAAGQRLVVGGRPQPPGDAGGGVPVGGGRRRHRAGRVLAGARHCWDLPVSPPPAGHPPRRPRPPPRPPRPPPPPPRPPSAPPASRSTSLQFKGLRAPIRHFQVGIPCGISIALLSGDGPRGSSRQRTGCRGPPDVAPQRPPTARAGASGRRRGRSPHGGA